MRIGLITGEYPPLQGGIGAYTDILSKRLHQQGHDVFVFSNNRTESQSPDIHLNNTVEKWNFEANRLVNKWAKEHRLDILNLQFQTAAFNMSPWIHFMPDMLDSPFVTTFHDLRFPYLFPKAGKLRDWIVIHLAKSSDGLIVTNHEDLHRVNHLPSTMIPIGSNIPFNKTVDSKIWREKINSAGDDFLLAHFGFINHSKGIDTLLRAIGSLNDPKVKLLMIGGRTGASDPTNIAYSESIDSLIKELGLESQVIWTGYVEDHDVSAYLQSADIVTLPFRDGASFRRGSLMAAIEQTCSIITTQPHLSIPEFTSDNMMLIEPDNPTQLADAINLLRQSPERREELSQNAAKLREHFNWDTIAENTLAFFSHVMGSVR